jgi:hypothetical protein
MLKRKRDAEDDDPSLAQQPPKSPQMTRDEIDNALSDLVCQLRSSRQHIIDMQETIRKKERERVWRMSRSR